VQVTESLKQMLALRLLKGMDARTFHRGLTAYGGFDGFFRTKAKECAVKAHADALERELELARASGVEIVTYFDDRYPALLREIFDPPILLYIKGKLPADSAVCIGVVGSREATPHGLELAAAVGRDLAAAGAAVVSGLARGIDSAAHRGALEAGGLTVAVMGCGLSRIYPSENKKMAAEIAENGALVSEFPMKTGPQLHHFPMRNRIISGLSRGVAVVEAREKSGALITADFALEQGRDVYVFPGNAASKKTLGSNDFLKQGAIPVTDAFEILRDYGLAPAGKSGPSARKTALSAEEDALLRLLREAESLHVDEIVEKSRLSPQKALTALTTLSVKGAVRELPGKFYRESGQ
jgi:DNA processing protein